MTAKGTKLRRLTANLCEQEQIIRMVQWPAAGLTWYAIAKRLNADGIRTKTGKAWVGGTVRKLLQSRSVSDWLAIRQGKDRQVSNGQDCRHG